MTEWELMVRSDIEGRGWCPCHAEEDAVALRRALLAVLDRMGAEIDAGQRPENLGKPGVPAPMLRVYVLEEIERALKTGESE